MWLGLVLQGISSYLNISWRMAATWRHVDLDLSPLEREGVHTRTCEHKHNKCSASLFINLELQLVILSVAVNLALAAVF